MILTQNISPILTPTPVLAQIHHLFCKIPHYKLETATKAFRDTYPDLVRKSDKPAIPDFMRIFQVFSRQRCIADDVDIHVFRD